MHASSCEDVHGVGRRGIAKHEADVPNEPRANIPNVLFVRRYLSLQEQRTTPSCPAGLNSAGTGVPSTSPEPREAIVMCSPDPSTPPFPLFSPFLPTSGGLITEGTSLLASRKVVVISPPAVTLTGFSPSSVDDEIEVPDTSRSEEENERLSLAHAPGLSDATASPTPPPSPPPRAPDAEGGVKAPFETFRLNSRFFRGPDVAVGPPR